MRAEERVEGCCQRNAKEKGGKKTTCTFCVLAFFSLTRSFPRLIARLLAPIIIHHQSGLLQNSALFPRRRCFYRCEEGEERGAAARINAKSPDKHLKKSHATLLFFLLLALSLSLSLVLHSFSLSPHFPLSSFFFAPLGKSTTTRLRPSPNSTRLEKEKNR